MNKHIIPVIIILLLSASLVSGINIETNVKSIDGNHPPIVIDGNDEFTYENGITGGSGTIGDPYIIEDWIIVNDSSTKNGILINNTDVYFFIRNCTICNFTDKYEAGIRLEYVENGRIENTISIRCQIAIRIRYSAYIDIFNCTSDDYSTVWFAGGVNAYYSSYINISSCEFYGKGTGIDLYETSYSVIDNTSCHHNSYYGIEINGRYCKYKYNTIKDCEIYNNDNQGIRLSADTDRWHSAYTKVLRCKIYENGVQPDSSFGEAGIKVVKNHKNIIEDCNIYNNGEGISIDASRGNIIHNCRIYGHFKDTGFIAEGIVITRDYIGPLIMKKNKIINCEIYDNEMGIFTYRTLGVSIEHNNISNNSYLGVVSMGSLMTNVNYNNIIDNGGFKVVLDCGGVCSRVSYINARNNWWGSPLGPSRLLPLRGDYIKTILGICTSIPWSKEPIPDAGMQ